MVEEAKKKKMGSKGKRKKEDSTEEKVHVHVEEDFPRGGGSGLAPVELKRIQKEAEAEALEAEGGSGGSKKRSKRRKSSEHDIDEDDFFSSLSVVEKLPKFAELLKFKSLTVGTKVLGMVVEMNPTYMLVSLPHGLTGRVLLENASDYLPKGINNSKLLKKKEDITKAKVHSFHLSSLFELGQYVKCYVTKLHGQGDGAGKKRIELSTRAQDVNCGLAGDTVREGAVLTACIKSVEDHGYLLDFGIRSTSGFLLKKHSSRKSLTQGSILEVYIRSIKGDGHAIVSALDDEVVSKPISEWEGVNINSLVPGSLVSAKVRNVLSDGILVSFLTFFVGTIDPFHLGKDAKSFIDGQKIKARIIYIEPTTKRIGLSVLPHLLDMKLPKLPPKGTMFEGAIVKRVDPGLGVLFNLPDDKEQEHFIPGYAHISNLADTKVEDIGSKFKCGQLLKCRVIGLRPIDGLASVSLKPSVVESSILDLSDISIGLKVNGIVEKIDEKAIFLRLAPHLKGMVPTLHMSDAASVNAYKKFKVGQKVKGRILEIDNNRKRVKVSLKQSLVDSSLPIISCFEDAKAGMRSHGVVSGIIDKGIFVAFFNDISGLVGLDELGLTSDQTPQNAFTVGQIVKVRVVSVNLQRRRLKLSLLSKKGAAKMALQRNPMENIILGNYVDGVIKYIIASEKDSDSEPAAYVLDLSPVKGNTKQTEGNLVGRIEFSHLGDHPLICQAFSEVLRVGDKLSDLVVLERLESIGQLRLTRKRSIRGAVKDGVIPKNFDDVDIGSTIIGFVASITADAVFVRFLGHLTGRAGLAHLSDTFVSDPKSLFSVGMTVRASVLSKDDKNEKFAVSLKPSLCYSNDCALQRSLFSDLEILNRMNMEQDPDSAINWEKDFAFGSNVEARVHSIKDYGVLCDLTLHPDIVGLVPNDQLGCDPSSLNEGDEISPVILDISKKDGIVDLSDLETVKDAIKSQNTSEVYSIGECVEVTVILSKPEECYCVVLMPPGRFPMLGYLGVGDYNTIMTNDVAHRPGLTCKARVVALPAAENDNHLLLVPELVQNVFKNGKRRRSLKNTPTPGSVVQIKVDSIHLLHADVILDGSGQRGRLHITQVCEMDENCDAKSLENPLRTLSPGSSYSAVVLETGTSGKGDHRIDVSLLKGKFEANSLAKEWKNLTVGHELYGYVQEVKNDYVWVTFSPSMRGRAFIPALADTIDDCCQISQKYIVGKHVRSKILHVDVSKHILDITFIEDVRVEKAFKTGDVVLAYITNLSGNGVKAKLSWDTYGLANLTDVHVAPFKNILSKLETNTFARARILGSKSEKFQNISFLESLGGCCRIGKDNTATSPAASTPNPELRLSDVSVGDIVSGYVKSAGKVGVFVTLSRNVDARIKLRQLSDNFVEDPCSTFPPGTLVSGTVISVANGKVDMTLRKRRVTLSLDKYHEGQVVAGKVKQIESYGIFIAIRDSNVSGLAHVSELCDGYVQDIHKLFTVGQEVQARILSIDNQAGKMSLGLKPSYFDLGDLSESDNAADVVDIEEDEGDDLDAELLENLESGGEEDDGRIDHPAPSSSSLTSEEESDLDAKLLDEASEDSD
eukprot:jgi/Picsp_1/6355/NSC_03704-R1_protein rrp5 homolog